MEDSSDCLPGDFSAQARVLLSKDDESEVAETSFFTQADALFRKNLTFQKRNKKSNCCLILVPVFFCLLVGASQHFFNQLMRAMAARNIKCPCSCRVEDAACRRQCSYFAELTRMGQCPITSPLKPPPLLQLPPAPFRATRSSADSHDGLPRGGCRKKGTCPVSILATGSDTSFGQNLLQKMFPFTTPSDVSDYIETYNNLFGAAMKDPRRSGLGVDQPLPQSFNSSDFVEIFSHFVLGTDGPPPRDQHEFPGDLYNLQYTCRGNSDFMLPFQVKNYTSATVNPHMTSFDSYFLNPRAVIRCLKVLTLWRNSSSIIKDELFQGNQQMNAAKRPNQFLAAYDFLNTNEKTFNMSVWYNSSSRPYDSTKGMFLLRIPRSINIVSNAFVGVLGGAGIKMNLEFTNEMPKTADVIERISLTSVLAPELIMWVTQLLFPIMLRTLVYEKQQKLRLMMKMHGLRDTAYWTISYIYFIFISSSYIFLFVIFGSYTGFEMFNLNSYVVQFLFFFTFINLQIVLAFLFAAILSEVKTATVVGFIYIIASNLLVPLFFGDYLTDTSVPATLIMSLETFPPFSLYRGVTELSWATTGLRWSDLHNEENGMKNVLTIMFTEWLLLLPVSYYIDHAFSVDGQRSVLSFSRRHHLNISLQHKSENSMEPELFDVKQERKVVEQLLREPSTNHAIIADDIKKIYPGKDGNPDKFAVRGLSLALPIGECFGMLGPNGAGKTSFISMMIGLTAPTSGTAYVQGMDITADMEKIYTRMGVCPQFDLLWETLTAREHLMFYGRLKNLKGAALTQAVDESLKSVNLYNGGIGDKQSGKYSGGMKRQLSVAISLIGNPKVVYMDEPSTGLDPASRKILWNAVKRAKVDRAIYLTTHSMEEAEALCDRVGIFVNGSLQCIGNARELKSRYGGVLILTITTASADEEAEIESLVRRLSPNGKRVYHLSGTQKFELPRKEISISDVFREVENAKKRLNIQAWGLSDATLEDALIQVAKEALATK